MNSLAPSQRSSMTTATSPLTPSSPLNSSTVMSFSPTTSPMAMVLASAPHSISPSILSTTIQPPLTTLIPPSQKPTSLTVKHPLSSKDSSPLMTLRSTPEKQKNPLSPIHSSVIPSMVSPSMPMAHGHLIPQIPPTTHSLLVIRKSSMSITKSPTLVD